MLPLSDKTILNERTNEILNEDQLMESWQRLHEADLLDFYSSDVAEMLHWTTNKYVYKFSIINN